MLVIICLLCLLTQCRALKVSEKLSEYEKLKEIEKFEYQYSLNEGLKFKLLGDLQKAVYFLERCIEIYAGSDVAYYELSNIYFTAGELDLAVEYGRKAVQIDSRNKWYYYQLAEIFMSLADYGEAIKLYQEASVIFPDEIQLYFMIAAALAMNDQYEEALDVYDLLEQKLGIDERISLPREHIYMSTGEFEKAHKEINRLIENFPNESRYYGMLAEMYTVLGMFEEAMDTYNMLFEIDPDNGMAQLSVAEFFLTTGKEKEAFYYLKSAFRNPGLGFNEKIKFYSSIIQDNFFSKNFDRNVEELGKILTEMYPEQDLAGALLSDFYLKTGNYEEAGMLLSDLYYRNRKNEVYAEQLIGVYIFNEEYCKVIEIGDELCEKFPESVAILYFTGVAHYITGNRLQAIDLFEKALTIDVTESDFTSHIYSYLGDIYNEMMDYGNSDKYFNLSIAADSTNIITLNNYAYYLALRGENLEIAKQYSYKTIKKEPHNHAFLDTYAWILYKMSRYEEAEKFIELAFRNGGDKSFEIIKHYAAIMIKLEKYDEAENLLNLALEVAEVEEIEELTPFFKEIRK